jgi:hypothetical protein
VATECRPRIARRRSFTGARERAMAFVVPPRARCGPVRTCVARGTGRRTARPFAACVSVITVCGPAARRRRACWRTARALSRSRCSYSRMSTTCPVSSTAR